MSTADAVSLSIAVAGLVLGFVNLYLWFVERRVRLRVTVHTSRIIMAGQYRGSAYSLTVVNLSSFDIFIDEVGFRPRDARDRGRHFIAPGSITGENLPMPQKLAPREARAFYIQPDCFLTGFDRGFGRAFAETTCGVMIRGTNYLEAFLLGVALGVHQPTEAARKAISPRRLRRAEREREANLQVWRSNAHA